MAPLRGEHDEVQRVDRLDLEPRGAAPAGGVRRVERLHHDALVPGGDGGVERRLRGRGIAGHRPRDPVLGRHDPLEHRGALGERGVEQVVAVDVQHVEEQRRERDRARLAGAEARRRDLERLGAAVLAQRDRLAVEHDRADRERAGDGHDLRQAVGDVVERPRVDRHVVAGPVDLDAGAVELPVDRRGRDLADRARDVGRRAGEHRGQRPPDLERDGVEPVAAFGERDRGDRAEVAAQHQRAPYGRGGDARPPSPPRRPSRRRARPGAGRRAGAGRGTPARRRSRARTAPAPPPGGPPPSRRRAARRWRRTPPRRRPR